MADGAGRVISASFLIAVLVAATSWCAVAAASAPAAGVANDDDDRGMLAASRFLATRKMIGRRGACAGPGHPPGRAACSGAGAAAVADLGFCLRVRQCAAGEQHRFECCGGACTDVLASASNCGACGRRCPFGRLCCAGRCVAVAHDAANCGACGRACAAGTPCTYGMCGYA